MNTLSGLVGQCGATGWPNFSQESMKGCERKDSPTKSASYLRQREEHWPRSRIRSTRPCLRKCFLISRIFHADFKGMGGALMLRYNSSDSTECKVGCSTLTPPITLARIFQHVQLTQLESLNAIENILWEYQCACCAWFVVSTGHHLTFANRPFTHDLFLLKIIPIGSHFTIQIYASVLNIIFECSFVQNELVNFASLFAGENFSYVSE